MTRFLSWCGQGGIGSCRRGDTIQLARSCSQFARSSLPLENVPKKYFIGTALGKAREKRENRMVFYESWRKEKIVWFPMKAGGKRENRTVFYESWRKEKMVWFPKKAGRKRENRMVFNKLEEREKTVWFPINVGGKRQNTIVS